MPEQHSFNADGTLRRGSPRNRPLEKCSEPLATADMGSLRARTHYASADGRHLK